MLADCNYMVFYGAGNFHYGRLQQGWILQGIVRNPVCSNRQELQHLLCDYRYKDSLLQIHFVFLPMHAQRNNTVFYEVGNFHYGGPRQEWILQGSVRNQVCSNRQELQHLLFDFRCCSLVCLIQCCNLVCLIRCCNLVWIVNQHILIKYRVDQKLISNWFWKYVTPSNRL